MEFPELSVALLGVVGIHRVQPITFIGRVLFPLQNIEQNKGLFLIEQVFFLS
jgi:hypothetical protein